MAIRRWADLKHKASPERRAEIRRQALAELLELDLRGIRELAGKTQVEVAELMKKSQGEVSAIERRDDHLLSTLTRFVQALGGEIEVVAILGDKRVRLHSAG
jgi:hypothetical protein